MIPESDPASILPSASRVLPFFWTAPISVMAGGVMMLALGEQTLLNNWSTVTMGLTHIATLGFISMTLIGSFYLLVPLQLGRRIKAPRLPYFVHATFAIGIVSLCVGLAGVAVLPVFIAIGALFPALGCFFWPVIAALRKTRGQPEANPLRLAIGAFLAVAVIGIWVAHGHGGMKFPGPRGIWIEVHLAVALFGWIGGMAGAAFDLFSRARAPDDGEAQLGISPWWGRLLWIGIVAPCVVLTLQYLTLIEMSHEAGTWIATAAIAPAAIATWWMQPFYGLRRLRSASNPIAEPHFWQSAFCLAPVAFGLAAAALSLPAPQWRLAFGWVAIWGWAGLMVHAILREFTERLSTGSFQVRQTGPARDLAFPLHLLSIVTGVAAIATGGPGLARLTGGLLLALGAVQIRRLVGIARANSGTAAG